MKRVYLLFGVGCLLLSSCEDKEPKTPDYLLSEEQMVSVIMDMHLIETANNLKLIPSDSVYQADFSSIFSTHEVSKEAYDSSLFYYVTETDRMDKIYDKVLEDLYELESEVKSSD
ncbi:MAG: DUF4296 domain-containing protein [Flavobacteriales bacterium]|nr:DUF4296 domain-containing protein [Flavobacteriales bacterium]